MVLTPETDQPLILSGVGASLWALCAEPIAQSELFSTLASVFGQTTEQVAYDVLGLLNALMIVRALCAH